MTADEIIEHVEALGGVLTLRPQPGDGSPEISWGDVFFYYAPDGVVPRTQPFATIVTKDYPDDDTSQLDRPDRFRLNISAGTAGFREITGQDPTEPVTYDVPPSTPDVLLPHPVYGQLGWVAVINPAEQTSAAVDDLLRAAHQAARARYQRRTETTTP
jgi:hypothetical protein